jgi:hypothetical protein
MRATLFVPAALLCLAAPAGAQSFSHWLEPGTRIRVTAPSVLPSRTAGSLYALLPDTLVLARPDGDRVAVANHRIQRIELSLGRDREQGARRMGLLGAMVGAGLGATIGALTAKDLPTGIEASAGLGFLGGGLLGGGIGAAAGARFAPERWQAYRIDAAAARGAGSAP